MDDAPGVHVDDEECEDGTERFASQVAASAAISVTTTGEGWLYLAVLLDLFSRRVVGWATSATNDRFLALAALDQALRSRRAPQTQSFCRSTGGS